MNCDTIADWGKSKKESSVYKPTDQKDDGEHD